MDYRRLCVWTSSLVVGFGPSTDGFGIDRPSRRASSVGELP